MTDQERFKRANELQEVVSSKGYKWIIKDYEERIKDEYENFLQAEDDDSRLQGQVRLKLLSELKNWIPEEVSKCQRLEKLKI